jgi:hypothetical protein
MKRVRKFWTGLVIIAALLVFQAGPASAISPGISTPASAYPFMTRVYADGPGWCGGTLIAPSWVLTAAHCVVLGSGTTVSASAVKVAVGVEASQWASHWQKVDRVVRHPNFPAHILAGHGRPYDVALLHLTKPATQGKPIGLANFEPGVGWNLTEVGWDGQGAPKFPLGSLHYNSSIVRSDSDCSLPSLGAAYTASMFCARTSAGAPLLQSGDSGGPALIIVLGQQLLAGVEDANNGYDMLGSVHYVQSWITQVSGVVPTIPIPPPSTDRFGVVSYNQMAPGAPHNGYFATAWQDFVARSNTITQVGVTVGNPSLAGGAAVPYGVKVRLCTTAACSQILAEKVPQIINYGNTAVDLGDVAVNPGTTYYLVWYQPAAANGKTWVTYWWAGGTTISSSLQLQAIVRGYNR